MKLLAPLPFLLATPRWCLQVCLLKVFLRITTGPHPMVLVPRALISFWSPWRLLPCLFKVFFSKTIGLHLILSTPKPAPGVLIFYSFPWR